MLLEKVFQVAKSSVIFMDMAYEYVLGGVGHLMTPLCINVEASAA